MKDVKFGFAAGEFAPPLWARSDLELYALGAAELENFGVTYSGSARTRYPLRFVEFTPSPTRPVRVFSFEFSNDPDNTYLIMFCGGKIYFVRDGGYILEAEKAVTEVVAGVVTCTSHGYSDEDLVYLASYPNILTVTVLNANQFSVGDIDGTPIPSLLLNSTSVQRVFSLAHDYADDELRYIGADQVFDQIKFTHTAHPVKILTRTSSFWTFTTETRRGGAPVGGLLNGDSSGKFIRSVRVTAIGTGYDPSTVLTVSDSTGAGAELSPIVEGDAIVGVTIVDGGRDYTAPTISASVGTGATFEVKLSKTEAEIVVSAAAVVDGEERGILRPRLLIGLPDITQSAGTYTYTIPATLDAEYYNYYRSLVYPFPGQADIGVELGWIGASNSTTFVDNNIVPDFTRTPRQFYDPFENGQITSVNVTAQGTGYAGQDTITVTDSTGSGALIYPIAQAGKIVGAYIADGGKDYTAPTLAVATSGGSGATLTATTSELTGNYPAVSFTFQQRAGYAGTLNQPMTVWASRVEEFDNFATARVLDATDPYSYTLDTKKVAPIRYVLAIQQGLLIFTKSGVFLIKADKEAAVTALSAVLEPQSYVGSAFVQPVFAAEDVIYVQEKNRGLRILVFNANVRKFEAREISILSRHLFETSPVRALVMTADTENTGYGVFDNGRGFMFAINRDQNMFGFSPMSTKGQFEDAAVLNLGEEEHVYFVVKRGNRRSIEYMRPYETDAIEDHCTLDARISVAKIHPSASITLTGNAGEVEVTASAGVFTAGDVGKVLWAAGGRGFVTAFTSPTQITVNLTRPITDFSPQTNTAGTVTERDWWMNPLISTISGIPFEGETVAVVVDGKRQTDKTVVGGMVSLDYPGAIAHVGFVAKARLATLPPPDNEGQSITVAAAAVYYKRAGTLELGAGSTSRAPQHLRNTEAWSEPTNPAPGERMVFLGGPTGPNGNVVLEVNDGLSAEILRMTVFYNKSDDDKDN